MPGLLCRHESGLALLFKMPIVQLKKENVEPRIFIDILSLEAQGVTWIPRLEAIVKGEMGAEMGPKTSQGEETQGGSPDGLVTLTLP